MDIRSFVKKQDIIGNMMTYEQIVAILENLYNVITHEIPGDIVELGCNIGTTTMFIQKLLDELKCDKVIHVYDSWKGLPKMNLHDISSSTYKFKEGSCTTSKQSFINTFLDRNLKLPVIHSGWFADIPDEEYPEKICFAFFDGDFYQSIMDSFQKTYHKIQKNGIIMIDDCGWSPLPGVHKACIEFLSDKHETLNMTAYPDNNGNYGSHNGGGKIIKM